MLRALSRYAVDYYGKILGLLSNPLPCDALVLLDSTSELCCRSAVFGLMSDIDQPLLPLGRFCDVLWVCVAYVHFGDIVALLCSLMVSASF